jgi:hypothetical protein
MDWHLLSAIFAGLATAGSALNGWQNARIELKIAELRNELSEKRIQPLEIKVATLETRVEPVIENCPLLHAQAHAQAKLAA